MTTTAALLVTLREQRGAACERLSAISDELSAIPYGGGDPRRPPLIDENGTLSCLVHEADIVIARLASELGETP